MTDEQTPRGSSGEDDLSEAAITDLPPTEGEEGEVAGGSFSWGITQGPQAAQGGGPSPVTQHMDWIE